MLKIYNSLTQKKEIFKPIQEKKIRLYVCGLTVYDDCHIGHARILMAFDVIVRYLQWYGYEVQYVRNITDVDDKIIRRANENNETCETLTTRFIQAMQADMNALGLLPATQEPRATDHIADMIAMISILIEKKFAYLADNGDVYYDILKFCDYGALSHRNIEDLQSGARIEINTAKKNPLDFTLWKLAKLGEPSWESPWGAGRPGWHSECAAMSTLLLGSHFDIHGGGLDLIFPHHENEIAQAKAVTQAPFANIWMHVGYLQINKLKMSKSIGNFLIIRDVLKQYSAETLRYFILMGHYRSPLNYDEETLAQAHQALSRLYMTMRGLPDVAEVLVETEHRTAFIAAMEDDFNTPVALSVLFELSHKINRLKTENKKLAAQYGKLLRELGNVLGILKEDPELFFQSSDSDLSIIEDLIQQRTLAKQQKNWVESDRIRDVLLKKDILLEDTPEGTIWRQHKKQMRK